jgi:hypothetical protein
MTEPTIHRYEIPVDDQWHILELTGETLHVAHLDRFMSTTLVDAARDALKTAGWATKDKEQEEGGTWLVGVAGRLFTVYADYQVAESADGYVAVGCGAQVAHGVLYATPSMPPRRRLQLALEAAQRHSAGVRGPFRYIKTRS